MKLYSLMACFHQTWCKCYLYGLFLLELTKALTLFPQSLRLKTEQSCLSVRSHPCMILHVLSDLTFLTFLNFKLQIEDGAKLDISLIYTYIAKLSVWTLALLYHIFLSYLMRFFVGRITWWEHSYYSNLALILFNFNSNPNFVFCSFHWTMYWFERIPEIPV